MIMKKSIRLPMFSKVFWRRGEKRMNWADELKVAIVTKNPSEISHLIDELPDFENVQEMKNALYLIKEAYIVMQELKDETLFQMNQIKKNIEFLESTPPQQINSLDISS